MFHPCRPERCGRLLLLLRLPEVRRRGLRRRGRRRCLLELRRRGRRRRCFHLDLHLDAHAGCAVLCATDFRREGARRCSV